jgi:dynein heavy chain
MGPPGGGRNSVDPRFMSLFNVIHVTTPTHESLSRIFSTILQSHLAPFHDGIKEVGSTMTEATLKLYDFVIKSLPPTPSKFHYVFNMRDLSRIFEGLCMCTLDKFDTTEAFVR